MGQHSLIVSVRSDRHSPLPDRVEPVRFAPPPPPPPPTGVTAVPGGGVEAVPLPVLSGATDVVSGCEVKMEVVPVLVPVPVSVSVAVPDPVSVIAGAVHVPTPVPVPVSSGETGTAFCELCL